MSIKAVAYRMYVCIQSYTLTVPSIIQGFCIKTKTDTEEKVFVNICTSQEVIIIMFIIYAHKVRWGDSRRSTKDNYFVILPPAIIKD